MGTSDDTTHVGGVQSDEAPTQAKAARKLMKEVLSQLGQLEIVISHLGITHRLLLRELHHALCVVEGE